MPVCRWAVSLVVGFGVAMGTACRPAPPSEPAPTEVVETHEWSYEGEGGQEQWGQLNADFATCASGLEQSPVDLGAPMDTSAAPVVFDYHQSAIELVNNGHTVQATYDAGSAIEVDGQRYELKQFHFHGPSEHEIEGREFPLEIHFVHQAADGRLAVVGVLAEIGRRHDVLAPVFDNLPTERDLPRAVLDVHIEANAILPRDRSAYHYAGSLTTPPCTEGVRWIVLRTPTTIDEAQAEQYRAVVHRNDRAVQPLNGRAVTIDGAS